MKRCGSTDSSITRNSGKTIPMFDGNHTVVMVTCRPTLRVDSKKKCYLRTLKQGYEHRVESTGQRCTARTIQVIQSENF